MEFKTKQEQYEWWTDTITKIQNNKSSIRNGCREFGIPFWQYYEWKEKVQSFINQREVKLSARKSMVMFQTTLHLEVDLTLMLYTD